MIHDMILIAPSILSADFANLGSEVAALQSAGADMIHIDVMDGHFVPNITIGPCVVKAIRPYATIPLDVHLMINNPDKYIEEFVKAGADIITIHTESTIHLDRTIELIKSFGVKVGLSIVPTTDENILKYVLDKIDLVLIMTVNPGFGGQKFIKNMLPKIQNVRQMIQNVNKNIMLQVDGGIDDETAKMVINAGANVLVSGNFIFKEGRSKFQGNISKLKNATIL